MQAMAFIILFIAIHFLLGYGTVLLVIDSTEPLLMMEGQLSIDSYRFNFQLTILLQLLTLLLGKLIWRHLLHNIQWHICQDCLQHYRSCDAVEPEDPLVLKEGVMEAICQAQSLSLDLKFLFYSTLVYNIFIYFWAICFKLPEHGMCICCYIFSSI